MMMTPSHSNYRGIAIFPFLIAVAIVSIAAFLISSADYVPDGFRLLRSSSSEDADDEHPRVEFAGRLLQSSCVGNIATCYDLPGCMKCKSHTNDRIVNGDGHIQCIQYEGNEDFYNEVNFDGCCNQEEGGTSGKGTVCHFWKNLNPEPFAV